MTAWLVSAGVGLIGLLLWLWEKASHADTRAKLDIEVERHKKTAADRTGFITENLRLSTTIAMMRVEATRLNDEVANCNLPGSARERLNSLLARARSKTH